MNYYKKNNCQDISIGYYSKEELANIPFGSMGKNVKISKTATLYNTGRIFLGSNVRIDNFCVLAVSRSAKLFIGSNVHISAFAFVNGMEDICIEDFVTLAPYVCIFSSADDYSGKYLTGATVPRKYLGTLNKKVILKKHSIIGTGSTIMPGVVLGIGTAVGAHSFVRKSTKSFSVVAGIPAKHIKKRSRHLLMLEKEYSNKL